MDKNEVGARFRDLAVGSTNRPEAARLRDIFEEVEVALKARVPQVDVLAELHKLGFTMKIGAFKSALQRIRKERAQEDGTATTARKILASNSVEVKTGTTPGKEKQSAVLPQSKSKNVLHALASKPDDFSHIPSAPFEVDKSN